MYVMRSLIMIIRLVCFALIEKVKSTQYHAKRVRTYSSCVDQPVIADVDLRHDRQALRGILSYIRDMRLI